MKKKQYVLSAIALALCFALYFGGKTVAPKKETTHSANDGHDHAAEKLAFSSILSELKSKISTQQAAKLNILENSVMRGDVKEQQLHQYHQLARYWRDTIQAFEPYAYYTSEASKLENSEKSLTFAARLFVDRLMMTENTAMQSWLAEQAKVLFEKALTINPTNDSSKIGLGACFIFGNISNNPMEGILPIKQIVDKDPSNMYGQMVLALGGKKSGQYDKAIDRFKIIVSREANNIEAVFHIAECYDLKGDKMNAIVFYEKAKQMIQIPQAKEELNKRIMELKK